MLDQAALARVPLAEGCFFATDFGARIDRVGPNVLRGSAGGMLAA